VSGMLDEHVKPAKSTESVSRAKRIQTRVNYKALSEWCNTRGPLYEVLDQTDPVHLVASDLQLKKWLGQAINLEKYHL